MFERVHSYVKRTLFPFVRIGKFREDKSCAILVGLYKTLNPQLHSRSATYIKRNGFLIRKTAIKSSRPFHCAYHPLTP